MVFSWMAQFARTWIVLTIALGTLALGSGCRKSFVMTGAWSFDWIDGCSACKRGGKCHPGPRPGDCPYGDQYPGSGKACRKSCDGCTGMYPRLLKAFGSGRQQGCGGSAYRHHARSGYAMHGSSETEDVPGNFHQVPTRPVFGPNSEMEYGMEPTPAEPVDPGLESLPLKDMLREPDPASIDGVDRDELPPPSIPPNSALPTDGAAFYHLIPHSATSRVVPTGGWRARSR